MIYSVEHAKMGQMESYIFVMDNNIWFCASKMISNFFVEIKFYTTTITFSLFGTMYDKNQYLYVHVHMGFITAVYHNFPPLNGNPI